MGGARDRCHAFRCPEGPAVPMHVVLLRGINVGGRNRVAMSDLRELFTALGFAPFLSSSSAMARCAGVPGRASEMV